MAKLLSLEECSAALRNQLLASLRSFDQAILLPGAEKSESNGHVKNVVYQLAGTERDVPIDIFSSNWFAGISMLKVADADAEPLLDDPHRMQRALEALRDAIPSETTSPDLQVGPSLDADDVDCDTSEWVAGFDGSNCCVGLYVAEHSCAPEANIKGMNRVRREVYLVCKAGAGLAGQTFHMRLLASLKKGATLEECLERGVPGPQGLRRVSTAGSRNRARLLIDAAKAMGLRRVDTISDQASKGKYRGAITVVDASVNTIRKLEGASKSTYQYATAIDAAVGSGLVTCSNASDGMVLLLAPTGDFRHQLRNEASSCIPFSSTRVAPSKSLLTHVASEWRRAQQEPREPAHPDDQFVRSHFCWKNRRFGNEDEALDVEPLPLWGSHNSETWLAKFARELGLASCHVVRLRPEAVCIASLDPGKLRGVLRHIQTNA